MVIGSNSFTGSHIVDSILDQPDASVVGVSRSAEYKDWFLPYKGRSNPSFEFYQIDIAREFKHLVQLLEKVRPAVVINVAALSEVMMSHDVPEEYYVTNTLAVVKLCDYLRSCSYLEQYVHISTAEVFGSCTRPVDEEASLNPSTPYAVSKAAADLHLHTLIKNFGFPATLIRSTNVYGKHQQLYKIIPRSIIYLKLGKPIELHGGGKAIKSFVHVRDVARGVMLAIERGRPGIYHFTSPEHASVAEVVRRICDWMGHDFESAVCESSERAGQDFRYWLDCSKAKNELGWKTMIPFEQGFQEVLEWVENHWSAIQQEPLTYVHKKYPPAAVRV